MLNSWTGVVSGTTISIKMHQISVHFKQMRRIFFRYNKCNQAELSFSFSFCFITTTQMQQKLLMNQSCFFTNQSMFDSTTLNCFNTFLAFYFYFWPGQVTCSQKKVKLTNFGSKKYMFTS